MNANADQTELVARFHMLEAKRLALQHEMNEVLGKLAELMGPSGQLAERAKSIAAAEDFVFGNYSELLARLAQ